MAATSLTPPAHGADVTAGERFTASVVPLDVCWRVGDGHMGFKCPEQNLLSGKPSPVALLFLFTTQTQAAAAKQLRCTSPACYEPLPQTFLFLPHMFCAGVFPWQQLQHVFAGSERCSWLLWLATSSCNLENKRAVFYALNRTGPPRAYAYDPLPGAVSTPPRERA